MIEFERKDVFLGTVPGELYGYKRPLRVTVDVRISRQEHGHEQFTIEHEPVINPARLSIMLSVWRPQKDDCVACGQHREGLTELIEHGTFAKGFDAGKAQWLLAIWDRWHLNDMKAGCAHVTPVYEKDGHQRVSLDRTPPCPHTGYRYGHAWLVEELPADMQAELEAALPAA